MNIQIFGTKKCNDTKKAERFFKERGIKYQFIDMKEKGMSKGEFTSVAQVNGGLENMINWEGRDKDTLALVMISRSLSIQSRRLIPIVMVRTSRFSCSIILFVSLTSKILIMSTLLFCMIRLNTMHYIKDIFVLTADHYADRIANFRKFL